MAPDLAVDVALGDNSSVVLVLKNSGGGEYRDRMGSLNYSVDGESIGTYRLSNSADTAFRSPGGEVRIQTAVRLAGGSRKVCATVNANSWEPDVRNNSVCRDLVALRLEGPDWTIRELLRNDQGNLVIRIANVGTAPSRGEGAAVRVIDIDQARHREVGHFHPVFPVVAPGGDFDFVPEPPITGDSGRKFRVLLSPDHLLSDLDTTNNVVEGSVGRQR
ncbi:MAG: hypothetical protein ACR2L2_09765 [Acidobacteriota bacterium]